MVVFQRRSSRFKMRRLIGILALSFIASSARADILFEGYSKVLLSGVHVGYFVQRFEFDTKKQEFVTIYYLKTSPSGGNITESLKARSSATLRPISYQFTELIGDKPRTIDAQFKGETMTATIIDAGKKQTVHKKIPKDAFLSTFLGYLMLQSKAGIKKGNKYTYQAIAEEDGGLYNGEAYVAGEESAVGVGAFKILNTFKGSQFISFCTYKAEVIATRSPVQKIATELVASVKEATAGLSLNSNALIQLFGYVPRGTENPVSRRAAEPSTPPSAPAPPAGQAPPEKLKTLEATPPPSTDSPKMHGVPGGTGKHLKGSSDTEK